MLDMLKPLSSFWQGFPILKQAINNILEESAMDISKQEKMKLLLEQMGISKEYINTYFKDSELVKLEVHKQSKIWHFHIRLSQVLPTEIYALLSVRLQETFQQFAQIDMTLYTDNNDCASETVHAYWQHFLQSVSNLTPAYKDLVLDQTPEVNNNKMMLTARNEAEGNALKKRLEQPFQAFCRKIGAPSFSLEID